MTHLPKHAPSRLDGSTYQMLRARVLKRDKWRCQQCGSKMNLEVHHRLLRSRHGDDSEENLVTLCHECHRAIHS